MAVTDGGGVQHRALRALEIGRHRGRLSDRVLAVAAISVIVAVGIALAVAFPLVRSEAQNQAREVLSRQADTLVSILVNGGMQRPVPGLGDNDRDGMMGDGQGGRGNPLVRVAVFLVDPTTTPTNPLTSSDIATVVSGADLSTVRQVGDLTYFIEGRSIGLGTGVLLVQRDLVASGSATLLLSRMALALVVGLGLALLLASVVARRTARPLRDAATAAGRLAEGERDLEVRVEGPEEIADISRALNRLAASLANSEDRQREFLMSVSHELRTPMTSIKGYAEALADGVVEPEDVTAAGAVLRTESERLDRLVSDLLDLSRSGAVDFRLNLAGTDVNEVARAAAGSWGLRCAKEDISFTADLLDGPVLAELDPTRLRQVIDNLVENAVRLTPAGGTVRLSCAVVGDSVDLVIEDSGPGLTDADIPVAFEPGVLNARYRKERAVGTGLGLALVGRLAHRMGGEATAGHSDLGGAKFTMRFPRLRESADN